MSWADDEFASRAFDLTLLYYVEQKDDLRADDSELSADLEAFAHVDQDQLAFQSRRRNTRRDDYDEREEPDDPARQYLHDLTLVFLGDLHRTAGMSLAKGELARKSIERYILCPDHTTLDHFLTRMSNFISPQYYEVAATLELMPA